MLVASTLSVSAETINDPTNDVYHITWVNNEYVAAALTDSKPNIDITSISEAYADGNLTLTLTVAGEIQNSSTIIYYMIYNTTTSTLMATYTNMGKMAIGYLSNTLIMGTLTVSADGKSVIATFPMTEAPTMKNFTTWAWEYPINISETNNQPTGYQGEWWGDWAPDTAALYKINTTENPPPSPTKTPGFEIVIAIAALGIAVIALKRRK